MDALTLDVAAGEIFGLLGPQGAGKSTTVRLLLGLLKPTAGSAAVLGFDTILQADAIRARTGALLDALGLYERLNAEENLDFYARIWHLSPGDRAARIRDLLTHFNLWERRREPVHAWSPGMQKTLAVARVLLHRPALVFLDEPTLGLDPATAAALRGDLAVLAQNEGVTIFLTTNDLHEAGQICRQVGIMHRGRLLASGSPDDLRTRSTGVQLEIVGSGFTDDMLALVRRRREVRCVRLADGCLWVELQAEAQSAPVVSLLVESGAQVEEVHRHRPSLQTVYSLLLESEHEHVPG